MPQHLGALGYRVGLAGKKHVGPPKAFPFEAVPGFDKNCVRFPTQPHDTAGMKQFIVRDREQPFCLVVALVEPRRLVLGLGLGAQVEPSALAGLMSVMRANADVWGG